jgi:DegV family protein with EDD domain
MAQGFVVMAAAKAAKEGAGLEEVKQTAQKTISRVEFHATFDTLEYLSKGGRIGHAWSMMGSLLKLNPVITLKNGVIEPVYKTRSRAKAIERLFHFAESCSNIEALAVEDGASGEEADKLAKKLGSLFPEKKIFRTKTAPTVGAHTGPSVITVAIQGDLHTRP